MSIREPIDRLIADLRARDAGARERAALTAGFLLERDFVKYRDEKRANEFYADQLGSSYADFMLTSEEVGPLIRALMDVLEDNGPVASTAAFGLRNSNRLYTLPRLAAMLRKWSVRDGGVARQAVIAIWDILTLKPPRLRELPSDDLAAIEEAKAALQYAADHAVIDQYGVREAAEEALMSISAELSPSR